MEAPKLNVSIARSKTDESIYHFHYAYPRHSEPPEFTIRFSVGDLIKKGAIAAEIKLPNDPQVRQYKSQLAGTLLDPADLRGLPNKDHCLLLFSIKLCQHYPRQNNLPQNIEIPSKLNRPIFNAIEICGKCDEPLWFYYELEEQDITYSQLTSFFDDFDIDDFQWKVILN